MKNDLKQREGSGRKRSRMRFLSCLLWICKVFKVRKLCVLDKLWLLTPSLLIGELGTCSHWQWFQGRSEGKGKGNSQVHFDYCNCFNIYHLCNISEHKYSVWLKSRAYVACAADISPPLCPREGVTANLFGIYLAMWLGLEQIRAPLHRGFCSVSDWR